MTHMVLVSGWCSNNSRHQHIDSISATWLLCTPRARRDAYGCERVGSSSSSRSMTPDVCAACGGRHDCPMMWLSGCKGSMNEMKKFRGGNRLFCISQYMAEWTGAILREGRRTANGSTLAARHVKRDLTKRPKRFWRDGNSI